MGRNHQEVVENSRMGTILKILPVVNLISLIDNIESGLLLMCFRFNKKSSQVINMVTM